MSFWRESSFTWLYSRGAQPLVHRPNATCVALASGLLGYPRVGNIGSRGTVAMNHATQSPLPNCQNPCGKSELDHAPFALAQPFCVAGLGLAHTLFFLQGQAIPPPRGAGSEPGHASFSPQSWLGAKPCPLPLHGGLGLGHAPFFCMAGLPPTPLLMAGLAEEGLSMLPRYQVRTIRMEPASILAWGWSRHCPSSLSDKKVEHHCFTTRIKPLHYFLRQTGHLRMEFQGLGYTANDTQGRSTSPLGRAEEKQQAHSMCTRSWSVVTVGQRWVNKYAQDRKFIFCPPQSSSKTATLHLWIMCVEWECHDSLQYFLKCLTLSYTCNKESAWGLSGRLKIGQKLLRS